MNPLVIARLALGVAGIVVWGVGTRMELPIVSWTGIGLLILTLLLRFAKGRQDH
jgi:hypothetical protein